jgi:hypothetical protein
MISLLGSLNTCKVNTGYAPKIQSDRFENPENLLCPLWNGTDNYGRFVSPDSFVTKSAGCNSAEDRVRVENWLRPQYMEYVALDAMGFRNPSLFNNNPPTASGQIFEGFEDHLISNTKARQAQKDDMNRYLIAGSAGYDYNATNTLKTDGVCGVSGSPNCNSCNIRGGKRDMYEGYIDQTTQQNFQQRYNNSLNNSYNANYYAQKSGAF